ncbi:MAG: ribonuclease J, partial [Anaerolineales bacterium]|nr:ribonuclease J [Anaerolineales bacterium]
LNLVRPKNFLPIHGELRQLRRHAWLAEQMGIPKENIAVVENGQTVELADGKLRLGERIPGGYVFVDGESIGDIDHDVMKEREQLARNGIVIIDLSLDKVRGRLVHEPEVVTRGFLSPEDAEQLIPEIRKRVAKAIRSGGVETDKEIAAIVKNYLYEQTRRKPLVFVTMSKA